MLLPNGSLAEKFRTAEDFFVNINERGLPFETRWILDKIKLNGVTCMFLCHRADTDDKNSDVVCSLMTMKRTELGLRVENIQRAVCKAGDALSFELFGVQSADGDYMKKLATGWVRPDLTDEATRYVAPEE